MPNLGDAVKQMQFMETQLAGISADLAKVNSMLSFDIKKGFQRIVVELAEIKTIISNHPEIAATMKDILE